MSYTVYIIEDDINIAELLEIALKSYNYNVFTFQNGEDAIKNLDSNSPDLIICDVMLPELDGTKIVSIIRQKEQFKSIPIIMLTAKDSEIDKIKGLDAGADDYMTKPFSIMELMARIRAQFRKFEEIKKAYNFSEKNDIILGNLRLNTINREIFVSGNLIEVTYKEYEILKYLLENINKPISREELLNKVWGYEYLGETRTVDIHIKTIRKKLLSAENYIKTIRGVGYKISE